MEDEILEHLCDQIETNKPSIKEVKKELEKISNRGRPEWGEYSPLYSAVKADRKDLVKLMIEDFGIDVESKFGNFYDCSALQIAICHCKDEMAKFLVFQMKAEVNVNSWEFPSQTPLIDVIRDAAKGLERVKFLVEDLGADVNFKASRFEDGSSPYLALHMAIFVELL